MNKLTLGIAVFLLLPLGAWGVDPGEVDDFEDGTTENWQIGVGSSQPTNEPDGGPGGAGDNYLQMVSTGTSGPGSRMVVFNEAQWTGDYNALGSEVEITVALANFGATPLNVRLGVRNTELKLVGTLGGGRYVSTNAFDLPADGVWRTAVFTLSEAEMTSVGSSDTLAEVLGDVQHLRFISVANPSWIGDAIAGTLGIDIMSITQLPVEVESFSVD